MPLPSIWLLRSSLICFLISTIIGALILSSKVITIHPAIWSLLPVHFELAIWGWIIQFVLGTAYWMFPKKLEGERRGNPLFATVMVVLFNAGLILLIVSNFTETITLQLSLSGRSLITASILIFAFLIWSRVVTYRSLKH